MSNGNWYDAWIAPGIILAIIATIGAVIGWIRTYLSGKKSNVKEARLLADETLEKAEEKGIKERADAKILYTEKTEAATTLEEKREKEAIKVKKEGQEFIADKFKFSDQQHAHEHSELTNELKAVRIEIKQVKIDLEHLQEDINEIKENNKPLKY